MSDIEINELDHRAVAAMEEMEAEGIPVTEFHYGADGYDFYFSRPLSKAEGRLAKRIAAKHIETRKGWSWL